jgi:hypothetical protein
MFDFLSHCSAHNSCLNISLPIRPERLSSLPDGTDYSMTEHFAPGAVFIFLVKLDLTLIWLSQNISRTSLLRNLLETTSTEQTSTRVGAVFVLSVCFPTTQNQ